MIYAPLVNETAGQALGAAAARRLARYKEPDTAIGSGLTSAEFDGIERDYGVEFSDDHRAFLAAGLPVSLPRVSEEGVTYAWERPWPDWRHGDPDDLRRRLDWPIDGVLHDVEHNALWHASWGERPTGVSRALAVAQANLARVPRLIPIYGHRYLPSGHGTFAHPVLSIWGADVIVYGADLHGYIQAEFRPSRSRRADLSADLATVPFWRELELLAVSEGGVGTRLLLRGSLPSP